MDCGFLPTGLRHAQLSQPQDRPSVKFFQLSFSLTPHPQKISNCMTNEMEIYTFLFFFFNGALWSKLNTNLVSGISIVASKPRAFLTQRCSFPSLIAIHITFCPDI